MPENSFACRPFSAAALRQLTTSDEGRSTDVLASPLPQVANLAAYLEALGATSIVAESHYIDRHYLEEFSRFYSRRLLAPPNYCRRLHFFDLDLAKDGLRHWIDRASAEGVAPVEADLSRHYLGYLVVRPLPDVPVGRTVVRPPRDAGLCCAAVARQTVHLLGLRLVLDALPFQQQDQAVAACATTAVWTALQRQARYEGQRPPTPTAVTEAGVRYFQPHGRAYPAQGLTIEQICDAFRAHDFPPEVIAMQNSPGEFWLVVNIYLGSGIPVVLAADTAEGHHAVVVSGYRPASRGESECRLADRVRSRNLEFASVLLHDDRVGPYIEAQVNWQTGHLELPPTLGSAATTELRARYAIVPLYPKVRPGAVALLKAGTTMLPWLQYFWREQTPATLWISYQRGGDYAADLYATGAPTARLESFLTHVPLSRYVAVGRWHDRQGEVLDLLWDTTDTMRHRRPAEQLLAVVARRHADAGRVDALAQALRVAAG
ncbi:MAG: hypothetical protein IT204_08925 [Fimbriimonadaceae bacterium]|nr:hypothetical protein [Fimbriimonadaceae bacterium]